MKKFLILAAVCFITAPEVFAQADIYIGVSKTDGGDGKIKIGISEFKPERANKTDDILTSRLLQETLRADLLYSRYFEALEKGPAINPPNIKRALSDWKKMGAQYVVSAMASRAADKWTLSAKVYNVSSGNAVIEKYYRGAKDSLRRGAHLLADDIVSKLTGKLGIARTKIAFSNDSTGNKEIYVVDYDGANLTRLTKDKSLALLPRWSHDGSKIFYTTYRYGNPDSFEIDLKEKKIKPFSLYQGLNIAGGTSPDGSKILITMSRGKDPNIYQMDVATKQIRQLTSRYGVNSSASYSPDGKFITFVSNISGAPQVHTMEIETGKISRLTRLSWCDSPHWSPSGEWIVFAGRASGRNNMDIFLVDITGGQLRQLTKNAGSNEDPSWSPDGRFIAFTSTRARSRQIYVMDADGSAPHLVARLPGSSFTPNWSK
ncbi:MAG: hypothetical protein NTW04_05765 [Elusimicrobia bacterium]|nr:hypothetical protein [Elusimicrobiota bacterium]